jgi:hypothetical protein
MTFHLTPAPMPGGVRPQPAPLGGGLHWVSWPHRARRLRPESGTAMAATWRSYVAEVPAWAITVGAMAVSFWTQVEAVRAHAFAAWEALIWGTSTDLGTLACLFLAREGSHRGTPTWGAWLLSIACAFMSVQFNVVEGIQRGDWLGVEAHVWMPGLALGVWYWTLHGRHRRWTTSGVGGSRAQTGSREPAHVQRRSSVPAAPEANVRVRPGRRSSAEVLALVRAARETLSVELGREPSDEEVASSVSAAGHPITASRVRTYLAQLRAEERGRRKPVGSIAEEEVVAWRGR